MTTDSAELARALSSGNPTCRNDLHGGACHGDSRETCRLIAIEQPGRFLADHTVPTVGSVIARRRVEFERVEIIR